MKNATIYRVLILCEKCLELPAAMLTCVRWSCYYGKQYERKQK